MTVTHESTMYLVMLNQIIFLILMATCAHVVGGMVVATNCCRKTER